MKPFLFWGGGGKGKGALARNTCTAQLVTTLKTFYFTKKRN